MAIIHTESRFNPMAVSRTPAYGMMMLVPRAGAFDAYRRLSGRGDILSPGYLHNASNNIRLGIVYFGILKQEYLKKVRREPHTSYLAIASYQWGIGNVQSSILPALNLDSMDGPSLLKEILSRVPAATRRYIQQVNKWTALYRPNFIGIELGDSPLDIRR